MKAKYHPIWDVLKLAIVVGGIVLGLGYVNASNFDITEFMLSGQSSLAIIVGGVVRWSVMKEKKLPVCQNCRKEVS